MTGVMLLCSHASSLDPHSHIHSQVSKVLDSHISSQVPFFFIISINFNSVNCYLICTLALLYVKLSSLSRSGESICATSSISLWTFVLPFIKCDATSSFWVFLLHNKSVLPLNKWFVILLMVLLYSITFMYNKQSTLCNCKN